MADLLSDIKKDKIAPVYYLTGERHPVDQVVAALRAAVLKGAEENDFNSDLLTAPAAGISDVLSAARTVPMLGGKRLVLVRDAHLIKPTEQARLLPYLKDPNPCTCLVLVAAKVDARLKFFQQLKKAGLLHRFEALKERQVPAWLEGEARRRRIQLSPGAAQRISESVGADMALLSNALEQLSLYVGPGEAVTTRAVEELLAQTRQRSIFELTNAVGRGQRRLALEVLGPMLDSREPGVRMVAMLHRHLRQLWSVKEMKARGESNKAMARQVGIHPFFVKDMVKQADRMGTRKLRRMHRALFEADWALKSSRLADAVIMQKLVLDLCPAR